jgi:thiamine biosynthesis lipoprotein
LINLWGFDSDNYKIPKKNDIKVALDKSGYKNININKNIIKLKNNISLNLGGIAKGRIIGEISNYLKKNGIKDFLINGGGDLEVSGKYEGKRLWRVAISDPFERNKLIGVIELTDCSIVTSGDYERNFIGKDGKLYHHILDPKTGYPANNEIHSVTVITDAPEKADALATALFVMGLKEGIDFVNNHSDIETVFIGGNNNNKKIYNSKNIKKIKKDNDFWEFTINKNEYE